MKRIWAALFAVATASAATTALALGVGTTGADFLKTGVGARALAMGNAASAVVDDANAIYWNPGALGAIKQRGVTASYSALFQDENQGFFGFVSPLSDDHGTIGVAVDYLIVSNIAKRAGDTESPDSTISNQNLALSGSYGRMTGIEGLSVGGSLKYIRQAVDTYSGNTVAVDFGGLYKTRIQNLSVGLSMQNLGANIGPDPLPLRFKGGVAYKMFEEKLLLASDLDWRAQDQLLYEDLGVEGWVNKALALRAGYEIGHSNVHLGSSLVGFSFGLGLRVDRFRFDYAFLPFGNLGDTHRVTLGCMF